MKKHIFSILFIVPLLSFGQLSDKQKTQIDDYALGVCDCVNKIFDELHPKVLDFVAYVVENKEKAATNEYLINAMAGMNEAEKTKFSTSLQKMQDPEYLGRVEKCDNSKDIGTDFKKEVDNTNSESHKYLMKVMSSEASCKKVKFFYDLGAKGQ